MNGLYRHSKTGNYYVLMHIGKHTETQEDFVIYRRSSILPSLPYSGVARRALVEHSEPGRKYGPDIDVVIDSSPIESGPDKICGQQIWIRPRRMWDELVEVDGKIVPRFVKYVGPGITDEVDY